MHAITNARFEGPKVYFEVDPPFSLLQQSSNRLTKAAMSHWKQQMPSCSLNNLLAIGNMCAMLQYLQKGKADHAGNAGFSIEPTSSPLMHCTVLQAILLLATQWVKTDLKLDQLLN